MTTGSFLTVGSGNKKLAKTPLYGFNITSSNAYTLMIDSFWAPTVNGTNIISTNLLAGTNATVVL
jgi:hypothetical protein